MATVVGGFYAAVHDADLDACRRSLDEGLAICAHHPIEPVEGFIRFQTVMFAEWTGAYDQAIQRSERAFALGAS